MGQVEWQRAEDELLRIAASEGTRIDAAVADLVVALRLLGFPTIGSCEGHTEPDAFGEERREPYVAIRVRLARRFILGEGPRGLSLIWLDPRSGDTRERRYLAAVAWTVNRPVAHRIAALMKQFIAANSPAESLLAVRWSWRGIRIEPKNALPVGADLAPYHEELRELGRFLRARIGADDSGAFE